MDGHLSGGLEEVYDIISGKLSPVEQLSSKLSPMSQLHGELARPDSFTKYEGPYEVIPKAHADQILNTANKVATQDIIVFEVPYHETHNQHGMTVHIAKET